MTKYELTIDASYLSGNNGWDAFCGIREIIQNARDAEIQYGATLSVTHTNDTLRIENEGCTIPIDALLIGHTTKRDNRALAGLYGEGLKFGVLALLRTGHPVRIRTGSEVWVPAIEASEKFNGRDVLVFNVASGREPKNRVSVEIKGISSDDWKALKDKFLFLYKRDFDRVVTERGELLLGDKFKGRIYVKGIHVQNDPKLEYGYNFSHLELDRDRRVIASYDLQTEIRQVWTDALSSRPDLIAPFLNLLEKRSGDVLGIDKYSAYSVPVAVAEQAVALFKERFGADAIPVANMAESVDIEHFGARGIVTSEPLAAVLSKVMGDLSSIQTKMKEEVVSTIQWHELNETERANLTRAVELVKNPDTIDAIKSEMDLLGKVDIVVFRSKTLLGQHKDGRYLLSRHILTDRAETLATLVHEVAHDAGGDGDKDHVAQIEKIWSRIVEELAR